MKVIYGTTEPASTEAVLARLREVGLTDKKERKQAWDTFLAGQVLATLTKKGRATYAAGFKKGSSVGRTLQKLCRPS